MLNPWHYTRTAALISLILLASCGDPQEATSAVAARPYNVVVIVVDTLRADHLGTYGYARDTSPFIDSLADSGVLFENAISQSSFTGISIASLISGRYPSRAGIVGLNARPPTDSPTLAARFKAVGYQTALVTSQHLVGVDRFIDGYDRSEIVADDPLVTSRALEFAGGFDKRPYYLYVHYFAPHGPYEPPDEFRARFSDGSIEPMDRREFRHNYAESIAAGLRPGHPAFDESIRRYDGEIAFTDYCIESLIQGLRERGLMDNTIVVLTADHGEEFLEHEYIDHSWTLYQEVLHVPLLIWSEGLIRPARVAERVSLVDVVPTLLALLGVEAPGGPLDGRPLLEPMDGGWAFGAGTTAQIAELLVPERAMLRSATLGQWKYITASRWTAPADRQDTFKRYAEIHASMNDGTTPRPGLWDAPISEELYDLSADPTEQHNVLDSQDGIAADFRKLLQNFQAAAQPVSPSDTGLSEADRERLKALGYL